MKLPLLDRSLAPAGDLEVVGALFERAWNEALVHRLTVSQAANRRRATRKQLTRGEVKHSTRKLGSQKGRGKARIGMSSSPIRRGGGRAFPNNPDENLARKVNRKEYRAAMATIVSQLAREGRLAAATELAADAPRTKPMSKIISSYSPADSVLFVDTDFDRNFALSARNLPSVQLASLAGLRVHDLIKCDRTVLSQRAVARITEMWL